MAMWGFTEGFRCLFKHARSRFKLENSGSGHGVRRAQTLEAAALPRTVSTLEPPLHCPPLERSGSDPCPRSMGVIDHRRQGGPAGAGGPTRKSLSWSAEEVRSQAVPTHDHALRCLSRSALGPSVLSPF